MIKKLFTLLLFALGVSTAFSQSNITAKVDMNNYLGAYTNVYLSGSFNSWCGDCNQLTDADNDGVYEGTVSIPDGAIEYKFTMDNWAAQEQFSGGESCTVTNGGFTNRSYTVSGDATLDVVCFNSCDACVDLGDQIDLPIDWNATDVDLTVTDFGGNASEVAEDPADATNMVLKTTKTNTAELWAGTTFSNGKGGFATDIPFDAANNIISVNVYSPDAGTIVRLKAEDKSDPTKSVETEATTTTAGAWEMLEFDFTNQAMGTAAIDYSYTYNMLSIFYNFGTTGADAGEKVYYCDEVMFGEAVVVEMNMVTFQVDMNDYGKDYTNVNLNGTFNGWCGDCALMTDGDADGVYELTVELEEGEIEYKFTVDGWSDDEKFAGGESCTKTTDGFTNRVYEVTDDATLDVVCWQSCEECGEGPVSIDVTFQVDMSQYEGSYTNINLNGTFNEWCGDCAVMTDEDEDNVYELVVTLTADEEIEYKFTVDGWTDDEKFTEGDECTKTTDGFTNRVLTPTEDAVLDVVCYASCEACPTSIRPINSYSFSAFPNPSQGQVVVSFELEMEGSITVFNYQGKEVLSLNNLSTQQQVLDLSDQPVGMYLIQVNSTDGVGYERVIVE